MTHKCSSFLLLIVVACMTCGPLAYALKFDIPKEYEDAAEAQQATEQAEKARELEAIYAGKAEADAGAAMSFAGGASDSVEPSAAGEELDQASFADFDASAVFGAASLEDQGMITGQIVDKESSAPVAGVVVMIEGSDVATVTDGQGNYNLGPAPAGVYTLSFMKTGYIEAKVTEYEVVAGETQEFAFALPPRPAEMSDDVFEMQDFVVTAEEATAMMMKLDLIMDSDALLNVMNSEDFSKYAASDISDAVKRVSGVSVDGGRYATVRGLGDRYVTTTLNGLPIASPDPDRLAVQLDLFPTALIDNIKVTKTFTPDQIGTSTGGIDMETKTVPDEFFVNASVKVGSNSNATGNKKFLTNGRGQSSDRWANGAANRGFPATSKRFPTDLGKRIWTVTPTVPAGLEGYFVTPAQYAEAVESAEAITDTLGRANHTYGEAPGPDYSVRASTGDAFRITDDLRVGYIAGLNHSQKYEMVEDAYYFRSAAETAGAYALSPDNFVNPGVARGFHEGVRTVSTSTSVFSWAVGAGAELGEDHEISLSYLNLNVAEDQNSRLDATGEGHGRYYQAPFRDNWDPNFNVPSYDSDGDGVADTVASTDYQINENLRYTERKLESLQFFGAHRFDLFQAIPYGELEVDWGVAGDQARQDEPGFIQTRGIVESLEGDLTLSTNSTASGSAEPSFIIWREIEEQKDSHRFDLALVEDEWDGFESRIQFGALNARAQRTVFDEYFELDGLDLNDPTNVTVPSSGDEDAPMSLYDLLTASGYFVAANVDLESESKGQYLMLDQTIFSDFRVIAGARHEKNNANVQVIGTPNIRGAGANNPLANAPKEGGYDQSVLLPSVTLIWTHPENSWSVRAAYSQTIALPSAREVSPYASSTFAGSDVNVGNIDLKPSDINNFDVGFSYRGEGSDFVGLNLFYKQVSNRIERIAGLGADSADSDDYRDYDIFSYSQNLGAGLYSWYNNPNEATLKGLEIEFRKDLAFVGLSDFSVGGNFTKIEGVVDRFPIEVAAKTFTDGLTDPVLKNQTQIEAYRERALTGQPEDIVNFDVTYDNPDWGFRVSVIAYYISDILRGTSLVDSYDVYENAYHTIDLTMAKQFGDRWKLGFTAKNITDSQRGTYYEMVDGQGDGLSVTTKTRDAYTVGRTYSIGATYSF